MAGAASVNKDPVYLCEQELDVKAGGGCVMTVGEMLRSFLTKLEWFSTLFPRIPVPVQKAIDTQMKNRPRKPPQKEVKEDEEEGDWHRSRYITEKIMRPTHTHNQLFSIDVALVKICKQK